MDLTAKSHTLDSTHDLHLHTLPLPEFLSSKWFPITAHPITPPSLTHRARIRLMSQTGTGSQNSSRPCLEVHAALLDAAGRRYRPRMRVRPDREHIHLGHAHARGTPTTSVR